MVLRYRPEQALGQGCISLLGLGQVCISLLLQGAANHSQKEHLCLLFTNWWGLGLGARYLPGTPRGPIFLSGFYLHTRPPSREPNSCVLSDSSCAF